MRNAIAGRMVVCALLLAGVTACDDPEVKEVAETAPEEMAHWQAYGASRPPDIWLASIEAGSEVPATDPRVAEYDALLQQASRLFTESPRMIANRLVQTGDSLHEMGEDQKFSTLLGDFTAVAAPGKRQSFGTLVHHYLILRRQNRDHAAALEQLRLEQEEAAAQ